MMPLLIYIAKASTCLAVLYGFYRLALQGEKSLQFNRFYLVAALVVSLVLPAMNATVTLPAFLSQEPAVEEVTSTAVDPALLMQALSANAVEVVQAPVKKVNWPLMLWIAYLSVAAVFFIRFALNIGRISYMILFSEKIADDGVQYVLMEDTKGLPYSFLHYVFVCRSDFLEGRMPDEVLSHEMAHSQQLHTLDILVVELIKVAFWFNPFVFLFKREIQLNHEFLADSEVLQSVDMTRYQKTLLDFTFQRHSMTLVSNFNYSFTKKRLIMMTKLRTSRLRLSGKIALLLPVLFASFLISATCQTAEPPAKEEKEAIIEKKVITKEAAEKKAEEAKVEYKKKMVIAREKQEEAMEDLENAKKDLEEQKKIIKMKKIELDGDAEDLEQQLEELMEELEMDLEGTEIDMEELMENIREGIDIDVEGIVDGVNKRIKVITPGMDGEFEGDMDFEFNGLEDLEELIELKHLDGDQHKMIFISDDGGHIEVKHGDDEKIVIINGDEKEIFELNEGGHKEKIMIISDEDGEEMIRINGEEIRGHDGEKIWIQDGDHDDIEREIKVIIKEIEDDAKSKKKKKRK